MKNILCQSFRWLVFVIQLCIYQDAQGSTDRQVFFLEPNRMAVRVDGQIRIYQLLGEKGWVETGLSLTVPSSTHHAFYLGGDTIAAVTGRNIFFYAKAGRAPFKQIPGLQLRIGTGIRQAFYCGAMTIGVWTADTIHFFQKLGAAAWQRLPSLAFAAEETVDQVLYFGANIIGLRTGSNVRFYSQRGDAPWKEQKDLEFNVPGKFDELCASTDFTIGLRRGSEVMFYWKRGQAPWRIRAIPACQIKDKPVGNMVAGQGYLSAAPRGVNAAYAWNMPGGKGKGIRIIDVEDMIDTAHEDLKPPFWVEGDDDKGIGTVFDDHGTSVVGIMVAQHNGNGIDGLAPDADYGISTLHFPESEENDSNRVERTILVQAINAAVAQLRAGDILLIEYFFRDAISKNFKSANCPNMQSSAVPVEFYDDCFMAIKQATEKGLIVVEPAANGGVNLDDPVFESRFDRRFRDSGAIMVGADSGGTGQPACWTNYGSRVDFFAWGLNIWTLGKGDWREKPFDPHKEYTNTFSGTSGAAPIIAGTLACVQGIRIHSGKRPLTASQIRTWVVGTAAAGNEKPIGVMPDLEKTIMKLEVLD